MAFCSLGLNKRWDVLTAARPQNASSCVVINAALDAGGGRSTNGRAPACLSPRLSLRLAPKPCLQRPTCVSGASCLLDAGGGRSAKPGDGMAGQQVAATVALRASLVLDARVGQHHHS